VGRLSDISKKQLRDWKRLGFSDKSLSIQLQTSEENVRKLRMKHQIVPVYKCVDTCAAEFESFTPYFYSTYEEEGDDISVNDRKKVMILGGGPNRIGQGIEFDYCCVHASYALRAAGYETVTGIPAMRAFQSSGPLWCTDVPSASTATVTGMSTTSNS
jgi:carbamoyl-phosphate synthase large subunit